MAASCAPDSSTNGQFCAVGDGSGNLITGTLAPTGTDGTSVFTQSTVKAMGAGVIDAVSCASASFCVAVDNQGNVDTWNGSTWSLENLVPAPGVVFTGVSCPTTSFCVATDAAGNVWTYSSGTWSSRSLSPHPLLYLSCASASFCMAVPQYPVTRGFATANYTYTGTWSAATALPVTTGIDGLSCPTATSCVATGGVQGTEMTWTSGTWSKPSADVALGMPAPPAPVPDEGFQGAACTTTLCIAGGYYSGYGFATTEANATSASPMPWNGDPAAPASGAYGASMIAARSCVRGAHTVCLAVGENGSLATYTGPAPYLQAGFTASSARTGASATATTGTCTASTSPACVLDVTLPAGSTPTSTAAVAVAPNATWPDEATAGSTLACTWSVTPTAQTWASATAPCPTDADQSPSYTGAFAAGTYTISLTASASGYPNASVNPVRPVTVTATLVVSPPTGDCPLSPTGQSQIPVLSIVSGSGQSVSAASTVYPHHLVVEAQCKDGSTLTPLPSAPITWTAPSSGASGTIAALTAACPSTTATSTVACTLTDSSGEALVNVTANSIPGKWTLPATWDGQSVAFTLDNDWVPPQPVGVQYPT